MKTIEVGTKIVFTETGEKYAIAEPTPTGFQFKPIKFEKGLPTVPRTFNEIKEEFMSKHIDIEGFEHNDVDSRLVELIMDGYIREARIAEVEQALTVSTDEKTKLEELVTQHEAKILTHEKAISEQQATIQEQKDFIQGQKDFMEKQEGQISQLQSELKEEKKSHAQDKKEWESEEKKYKSTIEGLETALA